MPTPAETADALLALGAATLGESGARRMRDRVRAAWPGARLAAPAYPVRCTTGDNLAVHVAVARAPRGSALVVDVGESRELGYWGEVLTTAAEARGIAGLVIDGGVRDVDALQAHGFPAFSTTVALPGATKQLPGTVDRPVRVGDVDVEPGDWVVGDADGVVIVPNGVRADVLAAGKARAAKEDGFFARLREGATTLELLGLDPSPVEGA
ncbi:MAG TPA: RraA family protein [Acidimicrobiia bacterium]|jgi:4-hydroxy-4-methyl-2-oxoglutarate aldolase